MSFLDEDDDRFLAGVVSAETQAKLESYWDSTLSWGAFLLKWGTLPVFAYIGLQGKSPLLFSRVPGGPTTRAPNIWDLICLQESLPAELMPH